MSNLLNEKHALAKLRAELEGRKGKLCRYYKKFGYLAHNCRNRKEKEKGTTVPQNKFEVLRSRVMQCRAEERMIRRQEVIVVIGIKGNLITRQNVRKLNSKPE